MKKIIVINGIGGVGKDTLCEYVSEEYRTMNVSSVDMVKYAARALGWNGKKSLGDRKFLAELKKISSEYNDGPTKYLISQYEKFKESDCEVLFVHIREPEEIKHFKDQVSDRVITLLVKRDHMYCVYGNSADDNVEKYDYDYTYHNNYPLGDTKKQFLKFFKKMV